MKKSGAFLVFILTTLALFISCGNDKYYNWKNMKGDGQYQWTKGTKSINNEVKDASLEVYIEYVDGVMSIQFWKQARYFDENESKLALANNENNEDIIDDLDYIKSSYRSDADSISLFENTGGNMRKDETARNKLILSRSVSGTIIENIRSGNGSDITFKDGPNFYEFRIYRKGLSY